MLIVNTCNSNSDDDDDADRIGKYEEKKRNDIFYSINFFNFF